MNKKLYYFLAALFFIVFLLVEFTGIFGNPGWFKAFLLIACVGFLAGGISSTIEKDH